LATLALKQLQAKNTIARALDDQHAEVLRHVGADLVVGKRDPINRFERDNGMPE
jgi:Trk K+ transport system NAD-binding subunit